MISFLRRWFFLGFFIFGGSMYRLLFRIWLCLMLFFFTASGSAQTARYITDAADRTVAIPDKINHIICSGSGCLRLISYLGAQALVVGVDDIEARIAELLQEMGNTTCQSISDAS